MKSIYLQNILFVPLLGVNLMSMSCVFDLNHEDSMKMNMIIMAESLTLHKKAATGCNIECL
uniref:Uncharacterized protein n=1 Tax=Glossina palpalis gambiensis TaxID=67801 RepID=A0A1B0AKP3_9MUSC